MTGDKPVFTSLCSVIISASCAIISVLTVPLEQLTLRDCARSMLHLTSMLLSWQGAMADLRLPWVLLRWHDPLRCHRGVTVQLPGGEGSLRIQRASPSWDL